MSYTWNYVPYSTIADYADIQIKCTSPIIFSNSGAKGKGLRITSKTTGSTSTVRFDETSSAFALIIGDVNRTVEEITLWQWKFKHGYYWKVGGDTLKGFAVGGNDIDESSSHTSLGKKLGDCSSVAKTLTVNIDGSNYNIVFNENFTSQTNTYVISKITAVIGSVADVDVYAVGFEYYPQFEGVKILKNIETTAILAGMAVTIDDYQGIKKAISADNFDGVCLDACANGQFGRVLTRGQLYSAAITNQRFRLLDVGLVSISKGSGFGISGTQAGYFDINATPKVLFAYRNNELQIKTRY
jgi:hypothetical protein